jgi:hypothetical protein
MRRVNVPLSASKLTVASGFIIRSFSRLSHRHIQILQPWMFTAQIYLNALYAVAFVPQPSHRQVAASLAGVAVVDCYPALELVRLHNNRLPTLVNCNVQSCRFGAWARVLARIWSRPCCAKLFVSVRVLVSRAGLEPAALCLKGNG